MRTAASILAIKRRSPQESWKRHCLLSLHAFSPNFTGSLSLAGSHYEKDTGMEVSFLSKDVKILVAIVEVARWQRFQVSGQL